MKLTFETIAIGDELLTGKIADTNSAYVAAQLFTYGLRLTRSTVVADVENEIVQAIKEASGRCRFVVCFGGLGPTSDDKTAAVVADLLGTELVIDEPSKQKMIRRYKERGREVNAATMKQVLYPKQASPLFNENGAAPGFECKIGNARFFFLPGVPVEMKRMFQTGVKPRLEDELRAEGQAASVLSHTWKLLRIPEADVQVRMDAIEAKLGSKGWLGYRTRFPENHLSLYVPNLGAGSEDTFAAFRKEVGSAVADCCYTESSLELEELIVQALQASKQRLVLAESCTGGMVAARLSRVPGASEVLYGAYVTYSVPAKQKMLGVELSSPEAAVSRQCSSDLAKRALEASGANIALGVTGYFGPTGGTSEDPVGTVYFALHGAKSFEERIVFPLRERDELQWGAATIALDLIHQSLGQAIKKETGLHTK